MRASSHPIFVDGFDGIAGERGLSSNPAVTLASQPIEKRCNTLCYFAPGKNLSFKIDQELIQHITYKTLPAENLRPCGSWALLTVLSLGGPAMCLDKNIISNDGRRKRA